MDGNTDRNERSALLPIVLGFMAGAFSGAAVALLLAPASGKETRAQLGGVYRKSTRKVAQIPAALQSAGKAARIAFVDAQAEQQGPVEKNLVPPGPTNAH